MATLEILVVDDDPALRTALDRALKLEGYRVSFAHDGRQALQMMTGSSQDAVILDLGLPLMDGLEVCRRVRERGDRTPVLMLTARDAVTDRVEGLDAGADDYLVKPFDFAELLARLRALQRRPPGLLPPRLVIGDLECDPASREVWFGDRHPALTSTELGILEMLMRRSPAVADRRQIAQHVWNDEADTFSSNTIDVHLARLRAKLSGSGARIETIRGVGYRIVAA